MNEPDAKDNGDLKSSEKYHIGEMFKELIDEQPFRESQRKVLYKMQEPLNTAIQEIRTEVGTIKTDVAKITSSMTMLKWGIPFVVLLIQVVMEFWKRAGG